MKKTSKKTSGVLWTTGGLAALLASAPAAQTYHGIHSQFPWAPPMPGLGVFQGPESGFFDGDELLDLVVRDGNELVFFRDPAQENVFAYLASDCTAMTRWVSARGRHDGILSCETQGLVAYTWSAGSGAFRADAVRDSSGLSGSRGIQLLTFPGLEAKTWLAGLAADGRTLYVGRLIPLGHARSNHQPPRGGPGIPPASTPTPTEPEVAAPGRARYAESARFTLPQDVLAWEPLFWDGPGLPELAYQTSGGMSIVDAGGASLIGAPIPLVPARALIERFHDASLGSDRLFWITDDGAGGNTGLVLDRRTPVREPGMPFGALELGQAGFSDYDQDGHLDLWLSTQDTGECYLLRGLPDPVFPDERSFVLDLASTSVFDLRGRQTFPPPPTTASLGVMGDFDLDGDVDLLFVSDDYEHVNFLRGDQQNEELLVPELLGYLFEESGSACARAFDFTLEVGVPFASYPPATLASLRVEVYFQAEPGVMIDPNPRRVVAHDLSPQTSPVFVPVDLFLGCDPLDAVYQFRFRLLGADGHQVGPARIEYFSASQSSLDQLEGQGNAWGLPVLGGGGVGNGFHRRSGIGPFCVNCP